MKTYRMIIDIAVDDDTLPDEFLYDRLNVEGKPSIDIIDICHDYNDPLAYYPIQDEDLTD